ncbi:MAG: hypothetical protein OEV43_07425, partial [Coriobacteriia bacterium]|nr:hypothetical protein [Coriobacteriia bacterium]
MKRTIVLASVLALTMLLAVTGCRRVDLAEEGYLKTETRTVALEGAEEAQLDLTMGAGELKLSGADTGSNLV